MKAYYVKWVDGYMEPSAIIWADTANQAKGLALSALEATDYTDIRVKRMRWADGMQDMDPGEFTIEELKHGQVYVPDDGNPPVTEEDIPLIRKMGGYPELYKSILSGELIYDSEAGRYMKKDGDVDND